MERVMQKSESRWAMGIGVTAWSVYALLTLFGPKSANTYHLSGPQLILIQLSIILPLLVIWLTAIYGAVRFKAYARLISDSPDGQALNVLTNGLAIFVIALILQTLIGVARRSAIGTDMLLPLVFLHNHLPMLLYLIGAGFIFVGSSRLAKLVSVPLTWRRLWPVLVPFAAAAGLLAYYLYINLHHTVIGGIPNFALPGKMAFYTMALPYLGIWLLGLLSITNILAYVNNVKGLLYRRALRYFGYGTMTVISFTIFMQVLTFSFTALSGLNLAGVLSLIYLLLIFYAGGFVLIARGARQLSRIEVTQ